MARGNLRWSSETSNELVCPENMIAANRKTDSSSWFKRHIRRSDGTDSGALGGCGGAFGLKDSLPSESSRSLLPRPRGNPV
jgi:hypothetical protein